MIFILGFNSFYKIFNVDGDRYVWRIDSLLCIIFFIFSYVWLFLWWESRISTPLDKMWALYPPTFWFKDSNCLFSNIIEKKNLIIEKSINILTDCFVQILTLPSFYEAKKYLGNYGSFILSTYPFYSLKSLLPPPQKSVSQNGELLN